MLNSSLAALLGLFMLLINEDNHFHPDTSSSLLSRVSWLTTPITTPSAKRHAHNYQIKVASHVDLSRF